MQNKPLISIITINYNGLEGLKKTVESVLSQTFSRIEYVIIDGASTDGSKEFIEKNKNKFDYSISEPDKGVYNAMNKGIKAANGEFLYFLNSGDTFNDNTVLSTISKSFNNEFDIFYGNIILLKENGEKKLRTHPEVLHFNFFYQRTIAHQAAFIRRTLFDTVFYYNEEFKIVSDWEFFICAICKYNTPYKHLDVVIAEYDDTNGLSSIPENKKRLYQERKIGLQKHFPLFLKDYQELHKHRGTLGTNRFKMLLDLEQYTLPKKIISAVFKVLTKLYKKK